jgi:hypothetical protein
MVAYYIYVAVLQSLQMKQKLLWIVVRLWAEIKENCDLPKYIELLM